MKRDEAYLNAIIREIDIIPGLLKGYTIDKFLKSEKTKRAVCMTLLNIGEAANKVSDEILEKYNMISWYKYIGFRNISAHNYDGIKMERVWHTCKNLTSFRIQIVDILK